MARGPATNFVGPIVSASANTSPTVASPMVSNCWSACALVRELGCDYIDVPAQTKTGAEKFQRAVELSSYVRQSPVHKSGPIPLGVGNAGSIHFVFQIGCFSGRDVSKAHGQLNGFDSRSEADLRNCSFDCACSRPRSNLFR